LTALVVVDHLILKGYPVLVRVKRYLKGRFIDEVLILYTSTGKEFIKRSDLATYPKDELCFVIDGRVNYPKVDSFECASAYIDRFQKVGLKDIILCNMAHHPQYSGKKLAAVSQRLHSGMPNNDASISYAIIEDLYTNYRNRAQKLGCNLTDPALFYIKHIFCDSLRNLLERINTTTGYERSKHTYDHMPMSTRLMEQEYASQF